MGTFLNPIFILSLLIALTVHEWSHAYVAHRLGDPTPGDQGRLSLNPIAHLDPLGALLFLTAGFGWAKPVPINPAYFKNARIGTLLVSAAGPLSNLLLAFLSLIGLTFVLHGSADASVWALLPSGIGGGEVTMVFFRQLCAYSLFVNLGLMAFNLLPIAPLDGSKVVEAFIPYRHELRYAEIMQYGPYILLAILIAERFLSIPILTAWNTFIMDHVLAGMELLLGL
jgi:Zn-dependent protease